jgi:ElaB/YqjD/DUF883 family membrane-anchored ribosome-binding protein
MPTNSMSGANEDLSAMGDRISDAASQAKDKLSDAASEAKDKMSELGRSAAQKIDQNRSTAASSLETAAAAIHDKADSLPGGEKVTNLAHTAADTLTSTADYVRQHDVNGMMADVERVVKNNPGPALFAAAVVGFLVGRAFSND